MPDDRAARIQQLIEPMRVEPGRRVRLPRDFDPGHTGDLVKKRDAKGLVRSGVELLAEYQERLAAQDTYALLIVLQALDAAGKDGTIRHVMSGVNPQGVEVTGFKAPTVHELDHDFLWRTATRLPGRGTIGIFNRSHYEEVLVVRVHPELLAAERLPPSARGKGIWTRRFRAINDWERHLVENGTRIVKLFLNVSREEQRRRFLDRIDEPSSNWKFSAGDVRERRHWDAYQKAYGELLSKTSTEWAPWYVIPADHKWFMRVAVSAAILSALIDIDPQLPEPTRAEREEMLNAREELLAEG